MIHETNIGTFHEEEHLTGTINTYMFVDHTEVSTKQ